MSDTTTLLHDYEISRQLAEAMNHASLTMKRSRRRATSTNELGEARTVAAKTLTKVLHMLSSEIAPVTQEDPDTEIPQELIVDLRERYGAQMPYLVKDLKAAIKSLRDGQTSTEAIEVIDKLSQSADSVASASFRRLRRR
jgi:hypothetical protein